MIPQRLKRKLILKAAITVGVVGGIGLLYALWIVKPADWVVGTVRDDDVALIRQTLKPLEVLSGAEQSKLDRVFLNSETLDASQILMPQFRFVSVRAFFRAIPPWTRLKYSAFGHPIVGLCAVDVANRKVYLINRIPPEFSEFRQLIVDARIRIRDTTDADVFYNVFCEFYGDDKIPCDAERAQSGKWVMRLRKMQDYRTWLEVEVDADDKIIDFKVVDTRFPKR